MELAEFLTEEMSDYKELKDGKYVTAASLAEEQMVLAVEANPKDPAYLVALANHLSDSRRRRSDANVLYQQVSLFRAFYRASFCPFSKHFRSVSCAHGLCVCGEGVGNEWRQRGYARILCALPRREDQGQRCCRGDVSPLVPLPSLAA
jgi:hypothetical protein